MALEHGGFQWIRQAMDTVVAQDIFQSKLDVIFHDMEGVTGIADDMIIYGKVHWNYNNGLHEVVTSIHFVKIKTMFLQNSLDLNPHQQVVLRSSVL